MTQSFGGLGRPALKSNRLRPLSILKLWGLPNLERPQSFRGSKLKKIEASQHVGTLGAAEHGEAPILLRFGFKASQYFGTLGAPKPGEASIFLVFRCKNAGRPQMTLMTQSFGGLGRPALKSNRLRPLSILKLWGLPNLERPQSFRGSKLKKIEASQHVGTLGAAEHGEAPILLRFGFKASQYFGTLGAPKPGEASIFLVFKCKNAGRPQKTLMTQSFGGLGRPALKSNRLRPLSILKLWGLPNLERPQSFRGSKFKKIEASQHVGTVRAPKH